MKRPSPISRIVFPLAFALALALGSATAADFPWREPHARVLPQGELEYAPRPFEFVAGKSIRHIDFEGGDDSADGSKAAPWKHHPWDPQATGKAKAAAREVHTYVFKGGVTYRGNFVVPEDAIGTAEEPIRLTRDPSWGEGAPVLTGAEQVVGWERRAHPKMPHGEKVWSAEVDFVPRTLWLTPEGKEPVRLQLARWPNWQASDPQDPMSEWPTWDQPQWWTKKNRTKIGPNTKHVGIAKSLPRPLEELVGGTVWSEWGIVMGSPYPAQIEAVDEKLDGIAFRGPWTYDGGEQIITGNRYFLEDLPQFLDEPGEFWVEKMGENRARIFVRLPGDADPNAATIEAGRHFSLFDAKRLEHIRWSGLTFRFGNVGWGYNHPRWAKPNLLVGAIRLEGEGDGIEIVNNTFEHLPMPVRINVGAPGQRIGSVLVADNVMRDTDHGAITIENAAPRDDGAMGELGHVEILRNQIEEIGMRILSGEHGHAVDVRFPATSHMAGNFLHRIAGWGLSIFGGKPSGARMAGVEAPLSRHLIHHNRVEDVLLKSNDWGGIETWQGGSHYVFNNIVINALGYKNWIHAQGNKDRGSSFGHAYYMDGSFKNYLFNNIGLGVNNEIGSKGVNLTAIQNIISFENWYFNNSFHRFVAATRQQAPDAGRFRYLGNVFSNVTEMLFRHADPKDAAPDPNAEHYRQGGSFDYPTLAYAGNVMHGITGRFGTFEETGVVYPDLAGFAGALDKLKAQASEVGVDSSSAPLRAPDQHDWRPSGDSPAKAHGIIVFVPWALARTVGEWQFTKNRAAPDEVIDEHWHMNALYADRGLYKETPRFPLSGTGIDEASYIPGPLANWTESALRLDGKSSFLRVPNASLPSAQRQADAALQDSAQPLTAEIPFGRVTVPASVRMGEPFNAEIVLAPDVNPEHVHLHLHWLKANAWGGFASLGGKPEILPERRLRFSLKAPVKDGLAAYNLMFFVSPDGNWATKTADAPVRVPAGKGVAVGDAEIPSLDAGEGSLLVEAHLRPRGRSGRIAGKRANGAGYSLELSEGRPRFTISSGGSPALTIEADAALSPDEWHHVLAEFDRPNSRLNLYIDGALAATAPAGQFAGSLSNDADFCVGGGPGLDFLDADLDFLRVALTSLAESDTSIQELSAWQFNGPQYYDFNGHDRRKTNAAGALVE